MKEGGAGGFQEDEKGVRVKNWPLGGKVEMILCHLERFLPQHFIV